MNSDPYATIILPIIDRAETMERALRHGLSQTVSNVEVLVACAGATREVVAVADRVAANDARVQVLDLPPSPVSTATARAEALRRSRSDRIFILQDDDIWFPNNVEVLGGLLDDHDCAISMTAAGTISGSLVVWPCTFNSGAYRAAHKQGLPKILFEAHYAFRRSAYKRLGVDWDGMVQGGCSRRLLDRFIEATQVRWAITAEATAVSLNSPPREFMSVHERAQEMDRWGAMTDTPAKRHAMLARASYSPGLKMLLDVVPPGDETSLESYLGNFGLTIGETSAPGLAIELTRGQRRQLSTLFGLAQGEVQHDQDVAELIAPLIEPFAGVEPVLAFATRWLPGILGARATLRVLRIAADAEVSRFREAMIALAAAELLGNLGYRAAAVRVWARAETLSAAAVRSAPLANARIATMDGRPEDAIRLLSETVGSRYVHAGHYAELANAYAHIGDDAQREETLRNAIGKFPHQAWLQDLLDQAHSNR